MFGCQVWHVFCVVYLQLSTMEYRNNDPGAVQYGNFINYYKFNYAGERLKLLPRDLWFASGETSKEVETESTAPYLVLDVGCNAGNLTQLLYEFLVDCTHGRRPVYMLGVDIDGELIKRATAQNLHAPHVSYAHVDVMDEQAFELVQQFLHKHQRRRFDTVCCFSITMWIHLNHGDAGLQQFLRKLADLAALFVVEPQPWKCYQTAVRRMKRAGDAFPRFSGLDWRSNVEQEIQTQLEQEMGRKKVFECQPTRWQRRICFYR